MPHLAGVDLISLVTSWPELIVAGLPTQVALAVGVVAEFLLCRRSA